MANVVAKVDCRDCKAMLDLVNNHLDGIGADLVFNCVNVPGTEMSSIIAVKEKGTVVFFSMATSFTKGILSTDGAGKGK
jgi:L-erythro-3,5-diaminohexanoate dehydrogenase